MSHIETLTLQYRLRQADDQKKDGTFYSLQNQQDATHKGMADFISNTVNYGSQKNQEIVDLAVDKINQKVNSVAEAVWKTSGALGRLPTYEGLEAIFPEYQREILEDTSQSLKGGGRETLTYDLPEDCTYPITADVATAIIGLEYAQCVMSNSKYLKAIKESAYDEDDLIPYISFVGQQGVKQGQLKAHVFFLGDMNVYLPILSQMSSGAIVRFNLLYIAKQPRIVLNPDGTFPTTDIVLNPRWDTEILDMMLSTYEAIKKTTQ